MALGDGIRRNIATFSQQERDRFGDAMIALNSRFYPGPKPTFRPAGFPIGSNKTRSTKRCTSTACPPP